MEIQEIINFIKTKKKHGIIKRVSQKTGVSMPTVRKYLEGDIVYPKAMTVLNAAMEDINNAS
jgi:response regulator of citrate/malate metabolism